MTIAQDDTTRRRHTHRGTRTRRGRAILPVVLVVVLGVAACGDDGGTGTPPGEAGGDTTVQVVIDTFLFGPDPVEVPAGGTIRWTNEDEILHTVTAGTREAATGRFDEDLDGAGSTATVRFDDPGEHAYHCAIHAGMDATVVVLAGGSG